MRYISYLPPLIWTAFVAFISLMDAGRLPTENWLDKIHADKIAHLFLYAIMFLLYFRAFKKQGWKWLNVTALSSFIAVSAGIVIEMLQWRMQAGRHFDMLDIIANIMGVLISVLLIKEQSH